MSKFSKICTIIELVGLAGLTVFGIRTENERHKTKLQLIDAEFKNGMLEIDRDFYERRCKSLENDLEDLKKRLNVEES